MDDRQVQACCCAAMLHVWSTSTTQSDDFRRGEAAYGVGRPNDVMGAKTKGSNMSAFFLSGNNVASRVMEGEVVDFGCGSAVRSRC